MLVGDEDSVDGGVDGSEVQVDAVLGSGKPQDGSVGQVRKLIDKVEKLAVDDELPGDVRITLLEDDETTEMDEAVGVLEGIVPEMDEPTEGMADREVDESVENPFIQSVAVPLFEQVILKLDTRGCMLKLLCHLQTLPEVSQQQQALLSLFSKSTIALEAYSDAYRSAEELLEEDATDESYLSPLSCPQIFSRCSLQGNVLSDLVDYSLGGL